MASTNISKAFASSGTRTKWTWSFWVKRATITNGDQVISTCHLDNNNQDVVRFGASDDKLDWWSYQASSYSNGGRLQTNRVFRDPNAWYHIVLRWDSSNGTAGDRMKMWVNGVEETSFATDTNPTSGRESLFNYGNNSQTWKIGSGNDTQYFDGCLSHIHFCDNQLYQASDFGETDSTTGEWKIKTDPSVSYGTNGFFILKDGISLTDQSPNTNNWSTGTGTLTKTEDCPSNVFATMNSIDSYWMAATYSNGNTKVVTQGSHMTSIAATLGASSGKYYWEVKVDDVTGQLVIGIDTKGASTCSTFSSGQCLEYTGERAYAWSYRSNSGNVFNNDSATSYGNTYTAGDIIGVALDLDNSKLYFHKNGTYQNSGVPTSGSTGTGAISITAPSSTDTGVYFPACSDVSSSASSGFSMNFGNGYFGTTAVSSAGTNASNIGIFEYDVPSGYTALCTKGLNE